MKWDAPNAMIARLKKTSGPRNAVIAKRRKEGELQMLLSLRKDGLTSLFKEVTVFKVHPRVPVILYEIPREKERSWGGRGRWQPTSRASPEPKICEHANLGTSGSGVTRKPTEEKGSSMLSGPFPATLFSFMPPASFPFKPYPLSLTPFALFASPLIPLLTPRELWFRYPYDLVRGGGRDSCIQPGVLHPTTAAPAMSVETPIWFWAAFDLIWNRIWSALLQNRLGIGSKAAQNQIGVWAGSQGWLP